MTNLNEAFDDSSRFKGWTNASFGLCKRHWAAYYRLEIEVCSRATGRATGEPMRLLEIGFGNGSFLSWARGEGHTVYGLEINEQQRNAARNSGFIVADTLDAVAALSGPGSFDGIVAFDVLEHLPIAQLSKLLSDLRCLLKQGGWILARFPNGDSPFGRRNQHGDLTHVTTLGEMAMRQLASATGLQLLSVGSQCVPVRRIGAKRAVVALLSLALRGLIEAPIQLLLNAYYPGEVRWFPLAPNLVVLLASPRAFSQAPPSPNSF